MFITAKLFLVTCVIVVTMSAAVVPVTAQAQTSFPHKSGSLVKDGVAIYLLTKTHKRGFASWNEFLTHRYRMSRLVIANDGDRALPEGPPMRAKPGSFVLDISDGKTIYLIGKNGEKQGFATPVAFWRYKKKNTVIWPVDVSAYPLGQTIE